MSPISIVLDALPLENIKHSEIHKKSLLHLAYDTFCLYFQGKRDECPEMFSTILHGDGSRNCHSHDNTPHPSFRLVEKYQWRSVVEIYVYSILLRICMCT